MSTETSTASKSAWKAAAVRRATLPSGTVVEFVLPNLAELQKGGILPNELVQLATKAGGDEELPEDFMSQLADLQRTIVATMVTKPKIAPEEVPDLPSDDVEMLVAFAFRQRDMDAIGEHISGLDKVESFRRFRDLDTRIEDVLDV